MSLMTESRTEMQLGLLPRVNLLPPEIAEARRFRQIQGGLGAAVLATVAVVGLLYLSAASSAGSAQSDLAAANSDQAALSAQTAKYNDVTTVYARAAAADAMLTQAMGQEVRFSSLLNNLSLSVPERVWLKNVVITQGAPAGTPAVGAPVLPATAVGIGTVTFTGVGFSHDDVAVWLESLATQKVYANPTFSNSTESLLGTRKIVNFSSTATLTPAAYSGRYGKPAGG